MLGAHVVVLSSRQRPAPPPRCPPQNVLDAAVGSICWYVLGYGFAYGAGPNNERRNAFIGSHDFGLTLTTQANWQGAVSGGYAA